MGNRSKARAGGTFGKHHFVEVNDMVKEVTDYGNKIEYKEVKRLIGVLRPTRFFDRSSFRRKRFLKRVKIVKPAPAVKPPAQVQHKGFKGFVRRIFQRKGE